MIAAILISWLKVSLLSIQPLMMANRSAGLPWMPKLMTSPSSAIWRKAGFFSAFFGAAFFAAFLRAAFLVGFLVVGFMFGLFE